jgi:hypothetical protein
LLNKADLVGLGNLMFYYPSLQKYMEKSTVKNPALAQTAFHSNLIPIIRDICENASKKHDLNGKGLVDRELWNNDLQYFYNKEKIILTDSLKTGSGKVIPKGAVLYPPFPEGMIKRANKQRGARFANERAVTKGTKMVVKCDKYLTVGMKGMSGRKGLTTHHNEDNHKYKKDTDGRLLSSILKMDAEYYL